MEQESKNLKSQDRKVNGLVLLARSVEKSKKENKYRNAKKSRRS